MTTKSFQALVLGAALLVGDPRVASLHAQDGKRLGAGRPYPSGLKIAFEWRYSCPNGRGCSFSCPGSGGGSQVTELSIYLGTIPVRGTEDTAGIFYEFSTMQLPRANGFALATGLSTLSCQVQGMNLDYSGSADTPTASIPVGPPVPATHVDETTEIGTKRR
jgi:hypothetical protein